MIVFQLYLCLMIFFFFLIALFLTSQTPKPNRTESKPNAIGRFGVPYLQIGFGA